MNPKEQNSRDAESKNFEQDYEELMNAVDTTLLREPEWKEQGDTIVKFSMYEEYTPVRTSSSTDLYQVR
jgi:hypothetical protein